MRTVLRLVAPVLVLGGAALAAGPSFDFMPDGGRGLFAIAYPTPSGAREALAANATFDDWMAAIRRDAPDVAPRAAETLAGYLSANAPLAALAGTPDPAASLPPDGKDLALSRCQSCHSLFTGYLMQRRDATAWRALFASPFHRGIAMTDAEIATFADYAMRNMPLRPQDVPAELRF